MGQGSGPVETVETDRKKTRTIVSGPPPLPHTFLIPPHIPLTPSLTSPSQKSATASRPPPVQRGNHGVAAQIKIESRS